MILDHFEFDHSQPGKVGTWSKVCIKPHGAVNFAKQSKHVEFILSFRFFLLFNYTRKNSMALQLSESLL